MAEQKKYAKYVTIGSVVKSKDPSKGDYIKLNADVTLKKGEILSLESKQSVEARLEQYKDKMKPDSLEKLQKYIERWPSFVRFEIKQKQE